MTDSTHDDRQVSNGDNGANDEEFRDSWAQQQREHEAAMRERERLDPRHPRPATELEEDLVSDGGYPDGTVLECGVCGTQYPINAPRSRCEECGEYGEPANVVLPPEEEEDLVTDGGEDPLVDLDYRVRQLEERVDQLEEQLDALTDDILERLRRIESMTDLQVRTRVERGDIDADEVARIREAEDA